MSENQIILLGATTQVMAPVIGRLAPNSRSCSSIPGDWVAPSPQNIHQAEPQNNSPQKLILGSEVALPFLN